MSLLKRTGVCCQPDEREAFATRECPGLWDDEHLGSATLRVTGQKAQLPPISKGAFGMYTKKKTVFVHVLPLANIKVSEYTAVVRNPEHCCQGSSLLQIGVRAWSGGDELDAVSLSFVDALSASYH